MQQLLENTLAIISYSFVIALLWDMTKIIFQPIINKVVLHFQLKKHNTTLNIYMSERTYNNELQRFK
jgi:hypothetical protein